MAELTTPYVGIKGKEKGDGIGRRRTVCMRGVSSGLQTGNCFPVCGPCGHSAASSDRKCTLGIAFGAVLAGVAKQGLVSEVPETCVEPLYLVHALEV